MHAFPFVNNYCIMTSGSLLLVAAICKPAGWCVRVFIKTRVGTSIEICGTLSYRGCGYLAVNERMSAIVEVMSYIIIVSDM